MSQRPLFLAIAIAIVASLAPPFAARSSAVPLLQAYAVRMEPNGQEAERFSRTAWGGGVALVVPVSQVHNLMAGVLGLEVVNLLSQSSEVRSGFPGVKAEQNTDQFYMRFYLGSRLGPHGPGFLRPFVGGNLALVVYSLTSELVLTDEDTPDEEQIRRDLGSETRTVFGYDFNAGVDLRVHRMVAIELGVRYLKSFGVPLQLGEAAVRVEPEYLEVFFGVALPISSKPSPEEGAP